MKMDTATPPFDPLRLPLNGCRLIEASAGTGKTYTIALLYLRLVLGHGDDTLGGERGWMPPELLVMTFTDAATQELRDRIRARLAEGARCFREEAGAYDAHLIALRDDYPPERWPICAYRLQQAAQWMDEAAISTIHGWCNRMLREHAFDSGSLFSQRLETSHDALLDEVVRDFWRHHIWPLPLDAAREVLQWWATPDALRNQLRWLLADAALLPTPSAPARVLAETLAARQARLAELKAPWLEGADELRALLDTARDAKAFNGQSLKQNHYSSWLNALRAWAQTPTAIRPAISETAQQRLTPEGLREVWKSDTPPTHPALDAMVTLPAELRDLPDAKNEVLAYAVRWVAQRLEAALRERAETGFDQLLSDFAAALEGPNGERLAARVRTRFPVALIDEFQDTDPLQYRIFDAVYRVGQDCTQRTLVFIGDPKQAIYSFRGADIHVYLAARAAVGDSRHTLGENHRSVPEMVAAVNTLFDAVEHTPEGAFMFATPAGNPVPFAPVRAATKEERARFECEGVAAPALSVWHLPMPADGKAPSKGVLRERLSAVCAAEVARLLALGARGEAGFRDRQGHVALRPADVAILVNNRTEAAALRTALARQGVRSVYLSERDSVFASPCVIEVEQWLAACAAPDDGRRVRAALATSVLGLDWPTLDALRHDERAWDAQVLRFRAYRECWRTQGVLPMLRRLMHDFDVPARLLARPDGERMLTDLLHVAELVQHAATSVDGEHALVRHFARLRAEAENESDTQRLRLESDAELVKIVSVHKAKGLEYPLVFIPFAGECREIDGKRTPLRVHDQTGGVELVFDVDEAAIARADRERLAEDVRKLYVALTRARHATWLVVAEGDTLEKSGLGRLLVGTSPAQRLKEWTQHCAHVQVAPLPEATTPPAQGTSVAGADSLQAIGPASVREVTRRAAAQSWWIASYSAMRRAREAPETAAEENLRDVFDAPAPVAEPAVRRRRKGIHAFPRGAVPGTFLHGLLEWAAAEGFARMASEPERVRAEVERRCAGQGWSDHAAMLATWLRDYVATPLPLPHGGAVALAGLDTALPEMEFWIAANAVDVCALDALVCRHTLAGAARPALDAMQINGMLKGFIDLVFEHEGRYYVADYKSNFLGDDETAYDAPSMEAAVLAARYDMQYVLYVFALHRLLRARLPDYDYARHMGGAVYSFLRGSNAPGRGVHGECPPVALMEALDALFAGKREVA